MNFPTFFIGVLVLGMLLSIGETSARGPDDPIVLSKLRSEVVEVQGREFACFWAPRAGVSCHEL